MKAFSTINFDNLINNITFYQPDKHQEMIKSWYELWKLNQPPFLPPTGLIVDSIAAIFWYETNSPLCIVDNFISNPQAKNKDGALDKLINTMFHVVKEKGFTMMLGTTRFPHVLQRAEQHGFKTNHDYVVFAKDLRS